MSIYINKWTCSQNQFYWTESPWTESPSHPSVMDSLPKSFVHPCTAKTILSAECTFRRIIILMIHSIWWYIAKDVRTPLVADVRNTASINIYFSTFFTEISLSLSFRFIRSALVYSGCLHLWFSLHLRTHAFACVFTMVSHIASDLFHFLDGV